VTLVLPVAVLFAVVFTVGAGRHSELTAAKRRDLVPPVIRPLLVASLVACWSTSAHRAGAGHVERRAELLGRSRFAATSTATTSCTGGRGWVYAIGDSSWRGARCAT